MTDLAKLVVRLEAETAKYQAELEKAKRKLSGFEGDVNASAKKIGAALGAGLAAGAVGFAYLVKGSIDAADEMSKLAQSTGVTMEALSQLDYAAKLSGVEDLGGSLVKFNRTISEAAQGSKTQAAAFEALGVSIRGADGQLKSTEQLLGEVAERFSTLEDGAGKTAVAMDLFGKSGAGMIPLLNSGADGIAELRQEANALGLTLDEKTGKAAEQFNDNISRMQGLVQGLATRAAGNLAPTLALVTDRLIVAAKESGSLNATFKVLEVTMKSIVAGGAVLGEIFDFLGTSIGSAAAALAAAVEGDWSRARNILQSAGKDIKASAAETSEFINNLYFGAAKALDETAGAADRAAAETFNYAGAADKAAKATKSETDALREFNSELERYNKEMFKADDDSLDPARQAAQLRESLMTPIEQYRAQIAALNDLRATMNPANGTSVLDDQTYGRAVERYRDQYDAATKLQETVGETRDLFKGTVLDMEEMAKRGAQNIQDAFADFLFDPFDEGLRGLWQGFADTMRRMAAEFLAQQAITGLINLGMSLFNPATVSGAGVIQAPPIGARAKGGPVAAGHSYLVGEEGPELVTFGASGRVYDADDTASMLGGGRAISVTIHQTIQAPDMATGRKTAYQAGQDANRALTRTLSRS